MSDRLRLADDARLQVQYSMRDFLATVRPFILDASSAIARTRNLEESVLRAIDQHPEMLELFVVEPRSIAETFGLRDSYLFGDWKPSELELMSSTASLGLDLDTPGALQQVQTLLSCCSAGCYGMADARRMLDDDGVQVLDTLMQLGLVVTGERRMPQWAPDGVPGIYRLQHASLLYRTATTGILVDPHFHSAYGEGIACDLPRDCVEGKVDAILVSHFHEDHWFLSTLLMFPRDTPIVVPRVPRTSVICGDMASLLRDCGFTNVLSPEWGGEPLRFGDCEVHVFPFFGEQPLRFDRPRNDAIRNWGNTYVIRNRYYSSWFLIDSGGDALGTMAAVAEDVRRRIGPIDIVLSNLRRFSIHGPTYINGGLNWLTLSPKQMLEFVSMASHQITLGPSGVAEVCKTVDAKLYLPYAHWWGEVGAEADSAADMPGQHEARLLHELGECIAALGGHTKIVPWHIGDGMVPIRAGEFRRRTPAEG